MEEAVGCRLRTDVLFLFSMAYASSARVVVSAYA